MPAAAVGADVFFLLIGAILVFAMHGGFAFLEAGTVRRKNQVNALVKILVDFAVSTLAYFFAGFSIAYGFGFWGDAGMLSGATEGGRFGAQGLDLVRFFFLATFAAAVPAIISGGIAERAKFWPQALATALLVGLVYPFFEALVWGGRFGLQDWFLSAFGAKFHDFAGSIVVHAIGGWLALGAIMTLGARQGRYRADGSGAGTPPSDIPLLALGSWLLCIGWFGFNVMSAQSLQAVTGLVAINSLMAMVGGILTSAIAGRSDPGFVHNGALAGLVAVCAGSDVVHPLGALAIGGVAGALFVVMFQIVQNRWRIDDVLGVFPLHGLCGLWGGIAAGVFGLTSLGGLGGVSFGAQLAGSLMGAAYAGVLGFAVYQLLHRTIGIRLSPQEELAGADLAIHKISAYPEGEVSAGPVNPVSMPGRG